MQSPTGSRALLRGQTRSGEQREHSALAAARNAVSRPSERQVARVLATATINRIIAREPMLARKSRDEREHRRRPRREAARSRAFTWASSSATEARRVPSG